MFFLLSLLLVSVLQLAAIPIENGVEGDPEVECGSSSISVSFNTQAAFEGHVYVKGRFAEEACRIPSTGQRVATLSLDFSQCGVQRTRSLTPRGVFVSTTVVITFHPHFITKVDRAYTIQCFYMEADKTVSQELEVSMLTTAQQTQVVPMPICRYDILDGSPTGEPVKFALVGQQVYHKWTCDSETTNIFCMEVHTCTVDDGAGENVLLLDEMGCAQDRYLLQSLEYQNDLMAGQQAHVFKYADRPQLFFNCQIRITIKEPSSDCIRPTCATVPRGLRSRRSEPESDIGTMDVRAELTSFDPDFSTPDSLGRQFGSPTSTVTNTDSSDVVCLSVEIVAAISVGFVLTVVCTIASFVCLLSYRSKLK